MTSPAPIPRTQTSSRELVEVLVERYAQLERQGRPRDYTEARTINEFILPLFAALGWDVRNESGGGEVIPEQAIGRWRADWALSIRGVPRVMVEAKPLGRDIRNRDDARQAINYSYAKGVTWAILTNFRATRLFNAEWALPDPEAARFLDLDWTQYLEDFDQLSLLSRDAVSDGRLDREAQRVGRIRLRQPVGDRLFDDPIRFRGILRTTFHAYNTAVSPPEIDHAVQRLLDRLIFLRAAEDRQIESPHLRELLRTLTDGRQRQQLWPRLLSLFREMDRAYDSQLFEHQLLDRLDTEPQPVWDTVSGLYETPDGLIQFDFRGIDADVLGGVYEQYLGHIAKGEVPFARRKKKSPEPTLSRSVRKSRGIFYTPKWLVRHIVRNALGPWIERHEPEQIRDVRLLDPACGSGSFLVEAFKELVAYWNVVVVEGEDVGTYVRRRVVLIESAGSCRWHRRTPAGSPSSCGAGCASGPRSSS